MADTPRVILKLDDEQYFDFCRVVSEAADFRHELAKINSRLDNIMAAVARLTGDVATVNAELAKHRSALVP